VIGGNTFDAFNGRVLKQYSRVEEIRKVNLEIPRRGEAWHQR